MGGRRRLLIILALLPLMACGRLIPAGQQTVEPASLRPGAYTLDPDHTAILWKADHLGFSRFVGRFDEARGSLDFDPEAPEQSRLEVVIETASVSTGLPDFDEQLRGSNWLDAENHPQARFVSRNITATGEDTGRIEGDFTLRGQTQPLTLDVTFNGGADNLLTGAYTLGFEASGSITRSDYGMTNLVPAIGDEVLLEIHAEFLRAEQEDGGSS